MNQLPVSVLPAEEGFLALPEAHLASFENARVVIQQIPYEHTSSYIAGSDKGPEAIVSASHFVEFYDEELDSETYRYVGIATLSPTFWVRAWLWADYLITLWCAVLRCVLCCAGTMVALAAS